MKNGFMCKVRLGAVCFLLGCLAGAAKAGLPRCKNGVKGRLDEKLQLVKKALGSIEDCLEKL